jgi:steroid delta-isomerase-like uncharacterized protein
VVAPRLETAWNARSGAAVAAAYAPDGVRVEYALPGVRLEGREAIAAHAEAYMRAIPDCRLVVRSAAEDGDAAVIEWTFRGTHTGDLPGLPAQGEEVALDGVSVCALEGGLIREERVYWDAATLMAGAGVLGA